MLLLFGILFSQSSMAQGNAAIDKVIKSSFSNVTDIESKNLILSKAQYSTIQAKAKAAVKTKIYRYYVIKSASKTIGYGVLVTRKMRTKKATVLYAFDLNGKLKFTEIMAFGEPPEFKPNKQWMGQFQNANASAKLTMGKDIPTISGSTLSARGISEGARIARAIYQTILK